MSGHPEQGALSPSRAKSQRSYDGKQKSDQNQTGNQESRGERIHCDKTGCLATDSVFCVLTSPNLSSPNGRTGKQPVVGKQEGEGNEKEPNRCEATNNSRKQSLSEESSFPVQRCKGWVRASSQSQNGKRDQSSALVGSVKIYFLWALSHIFLPQSSLLLTLTFTTTQDRGLLTTCSLV